MCGNQQSRCRKEQGTREVLIGCAIHFLELEETYVVGISGTRTCCTGCYTVYMMYVCAILLTVQYCSVLLAAAIRTHSPALDLCELHIGWGLYIL